LDNKNLPKSDSSDRLGMVANATIPRLERRLQRQYHHHTSEVPQTSSPRASPAAAAL